jgi:sugar porter (SP) family MFS transporter
VGRADLARQRLIPRVRPRHGAHVGPIAAHPRDGRGRIGRILFGYDTGVISDALLYIAPAFGLGDTGQQVVVAALLLGALVGALVGGRFADAVGRKRTLVGAAIVFAIAALIAAVAPNVEVLIGARVLLGFAIGVSSAAVPLYLAEIAPPESRGRLVSMNQFLITVGILASYGVGALLAPAAAWRWMLGLAAIPALVMLVGLAVLPESPRWLLFRGRGDEARSVLGQVQGRQPDDDEIGKQIKELEERQEEESRSSYRDLFTERMRPALRIGIGVPAINQLVGVNAVIYYTPTILKNAGFATSPPPCRPSPSARSTRWSRSSRSGSSTGSGGGRC